MEWHGIDRNISCSYKYHLILSRLHTAPYTQKEIESILSVDLNNVFSITPKLQQVLADPGKTNYYIFQVSGVEYVGGEGGVAIGGRQSARGTRGLSNDECHMRGSPGVFKYSAVPSSLRLVGHYMCHIPATKNMCLCLTGFVVIRIWSC